MIELYICAGLHSGLAKDWFFDGIYDVLPFKLLTKYCIEVWARLVWCRKSSFSFSIRPLERSIRTLSEPVPCVDFFCTKSTDMLWMRSMRLWNDELDDDEMETPIRRSQPDIRIVPTVERILKTFEAVTYSEASRWITAMAEFKFGKFSYDVRPYSKFKSPSI